LLQDLLHAPKICDRKTDLKTDRPQDRKDRQTSLKTNRQKEKRTERDRERNRETGGQTSGQRERDRQETDTKRQADRQTDRQNGQTNKQKNKASKQTNKQNFTFQYLTAAGDVHITEWMPYTKTQTLSVQRPDKEKTRTTQPCNIKPAALGATFHFTLWTPLSLRHKERVKGGRDQLGRQGWR
jgi:hypothetical protein